MDESVDKDLDELLRQKIELLLKGIFDLTTRNPLISTRFPSRGGPVRVVDELPDVLYERICEEEMRFASLPSLDQENP